MTEPVSGDEARGLLRAMRTLMRNPDLTEGMGCAIASGLTLIAIVFTVILIYMAMNGLGGDAPTKTNPEPPPTQTSEEPATSDAAPEEDNPTAVGQAVDEIARPAIEDVYGEALLSRASGTEALIVSLWYDIPTTPAEGDGERLRDAFISRGATLDPDNSEMDYHAGEEFVLGIDTGNPAYKTVRVAVSPDYKTVYVNADKSE